MITEWILPLGLSGVVTMVLGMIWYGPFLFGPQWGADMFAGKSKAEMEAMKEGMGKRYAVMFLTNLVTAFVIKQLLVWLSVVSIDKAMEIAFWAWAGFVAPMAIGSNLVGGNKKWSTVSIDIGYQLAYMILMATVMMLIK